MSIANFLAVLGLYLDNDLQLQENPNVIIPSWRNWLGPEILKKSEDHVLLFNSKLRILLPVEPFIS